MLSNIKEKLTKTAATRTTPAAGIAIECLSMPGDPTLRMKHHALVVFILSVVIHPSVVASDLMPGIVTQGAFLVSNNANVKMSGRYHHGIVGYLPVGTRVYFRNESKELNNLTKGKPETYYSVRSSIGIHGLLREDLFKQVTDKPVAVVVKPIWLHHPDSAQGKFKNLLKIGRYDKAYLEIEDQEDDHFMATLVRVDPPRHLNKRESVRLWKPYVEGGSVILVNTGSGAPIPSWSTSRKLDNDHVDGIVGIVSERLGEYADSARQILADANAIQCLLRGTASAKAGFNVFSNGLSFNLDLSVSEYDQMIKLMRRELAMGKDTQTYLILKNVRCEGGRPERLERITVQQGPLALDRRATVRLTDLDVEKQRWVTSLRDEAAFRMVSISDEAGYLNVLRKLESLSGSDGFVHTLPTLERDLLLNMILREIVYYENVPQISPEPKLQRSTDAL